MTAEQQYWLSLYVAVILTVAAAAMGVGFESGFTGKLAVQSMICTLLGVGSLSIVQVLVRRAQVGLGIGQRSIFRGILFLGMALAAIVAVWSGSKSLLAPSSRPPQLAPAPKSTPLQDAKILASQLTRSEWAQEGESCTEDSFRFAIENDEMVAFPKDFGSSRYALIAAQDRILQTRLSGRTVSFELYENGFFHTDQGYKRWFRRCE